MTGYVNDLGELKRGWSVSLTLPPTEPTAAPTEYVGVVTEVLEDGFRVGVDFEPGATTEGFSMVIPYDKVGEYNVVVVDTAGEWEVEVIAAGPGVPGWEGPGPAPTHDEPLVSASRATSVIAEAEPEGPIDDPTTLPAEVVEHLIDVDEAAERDAAVDAAAFADRVRGTDVPTEPEPGRALVTCHLPLSAVTVSRIMLAVAEDVPDCVIDSTDPEILIIRAPRERT